MPFYRTIGPSGALGLAGPHVLFLLTVPRAPRVSLTLTSLLPREPPPVPSLRRHAPTRRRCSTRSAPAPPHAPSSSSPAPRPRLARSAPTPPASRPRRACAPAPPAPRAAASHVQRRRFAAPPHARSSAPLPYSSRSKGSVPLPTPLDQAHSRCSRNCLLGFFFDFFPDLQGYDLYIL
jgi:hypothetical protein